MPPISSKEFKKRYAPSTKNAKNQGVWSGRGIAVPSAGALDGSGDGSKYLGRPRKPFSKDNGGAPSQSADSGMASFLARVNKGYDEYESMPMFPEQEPEDEHIYSWEDINPVVSRKLPRSFKLTARHRIREADIFSEDSFVENSRYTLSCINEVSIAEEDIPDIDDLENSRLISNTFDFFADLLLDAGDFFTGQTGGALLVIPTLGTNLIQLWMSLREAKDILYETTTKPTPDLIREADKVSEDIRRDLIDVLQGLIRFVPSPGWDGLLNIAINIGEKVGMKLMDGSVGFSAAKLYADTYSKLPDFGKFLLEWNPAQGGPLIGGILIRSVEMIGILRSTIDDYKDYIERATEEEELLALLQTQEEDMSDILSMSGEDVQLQELKNFILEEIALYRDPKPSGYEYREVPTIVVNDDNRFEVLDDYDDLSVVYKTDGGVIAYQHKNKLEEIALRNIIRRNLSNITIESKKKR